MNPAQVADTLAFGAAAKELEQVSREDPALVMSHYLTEMVLSIRRGVDINRILLTAMEAIYRCVRPSCVIAAFLDATKTSLEGRFYLGPSTLVLPSDFRASLQDERSPITRCLRQQTMVRAFVRADISLPFLLNLKLEYVLFSPIVVHGNAIGLCLLGREGAGPFGEQEELWVEAITGNIALAFERTSLKGR